MTSKEQSNSSEAWYYRILRRPISHVALAGVLLAFDYTSGGIIQFPITFVIPIALASWFCTPRLGYILAAAMPGFRLGFVLLRDGATTLSVPIINTGIRVAVLVLIAYLAGKAARLAHEVRVLEGILPLCSFCKKIRDERGRWQPIESYISQRTDTDFSHDLCEDCARIHYGEVLDRAANS